jgi:trehalose 6-phosphate synthase
VQLYGEVYGPPGLARLAVVTAPDLLLASNRGPVSWISDATGTLVPRRGGGGLVAALGGGDDRGARSLWVCAALSSDDRQALRTGQADLPGVRMLDIDPLVFERAYNRVANGVLWFASHLLWATPTAPVFDAASRREWAAYREYDEAFATALAEQAAPGARVLVQDYHLSLVPRQLRALRPDLRISHFSHTPWAPPEYFRVLPDAVATDLLTGLLGADAVGFHSPRWAEAFTRCCVELLGATAVEGGVHCDGRTTRVGVHPLGVDGEALRARAAEPDVRSRLAALRGVAGDRQVVLRVDRTELSKNIVRGLEAYRELLRTRPQWRERVVHLALAYPSRHDLPEYREYTAAVQRVAREVNDEFGTAGWLPVHLEVRDDYPRSLAACVLADVLVVNPLRDGMNLVAKEAPVLSERGLSLVLSREAGAADELGADALLVNPYDVSQTAEALHTALLQTPVERRERTARLAAAATALPPAAWLAAQLADL